MSDLLLCPACKNDGGPCPSCAQRAWGRVQRAWARAERSWDRAQQRWDSVQRAQEGKRTGDRSRDDDCKACLDALRRTAADRAEREERERLELARALEDLEREAQQRAEFDRNLADPTVN